MNETIKYLLIMLVFILIILVLMQNLYCSPIPNKGNLSLSNTQHFTVDNETRNEYPILKGLTNKENIEKDISNKEREKVTLQIVDNILKNEKNTSSELDSLLNQDEDGGASDDFQNPVDRHINPGRNYVESNNEVLDELIREVNTGNDLKVDNPEANVYEKRSLSKNHAKNYRTLSYKDSGYRYDYNDNGDPTKSSQQQLNDMYDNALIFQNKENSNNGNFKGFSENSEIYGGADLKDFGNTKPKTQQEKVLSLYNSNEYLPNDSLTNSNLTKGFQILDNPVAVSNPNLIPVLRSIAVPSIMGSNKNSTYDIRPEPPCPKTVVSPFLNSDIMPDIYAQQRAPL